MLSFIETSDVELLKILGDYELDQEFASQPPSEKEKEDAGRNYLNAILDKHRRAICGHPLTAKMLYHQEVDASIMLGTVMLIIVEVGVFGRSASEVIREIAALSTLLVRQGIASVCADVLADNA